VAPGIPCNKLSYKEKSPHLSPASGHKLVRIITLSVLRIGTILPLIDRRIIFVVIESAHHSHTLPAISYSHLPIGANDRTGQNTKKGSPAYLSEEMPHPRNYPRLTPATAAWPRDKYYLPTSPARILHWFPWKPIPPIAIGCASYRRHV